jgi:hypothetical protein
VRPPKKKQQRAEAQKSLEEKHTTLHNTETKNGMAAKEREREQKKK